MVDEGGVVVLLGVVDVFDAADEWAAVAWLEFPVDPDKPQPATRVDPKVMMIIAVVVWVIMASLSVSSAISFGVALRHDNAGSAEKIT